MNIMDLARLEYANITGSPDVGTAIEFRPLPASIPVTVYGLASNIGLSVDSEGLQVNARNCHISISESLLIAAGYIVRNAEKEVNIKGHLIRVADSTGVVKDYKIEQTIVYETLGRIYIILADYE